MRLSLEFRGREWTLVRIAERCVDLGCLIGKLERLEGDGWRVHVGAARGAAVFVVRLGKGLRLVSRMTP